MNELRFEIVATDWGDAAIVAGPGGCCRLILPGCTTGELKALVRREFPDARHGRVGLDNIARRIQAYFRGRREALRCKVDLSRGTEFQQSVWRACARVPYGRRRTYRDVAGAIGRPRAARAVGQALGRNPVPLIVPCHRVVSAGGAVGGFSARGGVALKTRLLAMEARSGR